MQRTLAWGQIYNCNKLQVIQKSLNRSFTDARKGTPTTNLMQMVAYHTSSMVHKVIQTGKPEYIAKKLEAEH